MTLVREYPAQWTLPEINLRELARLRWDQGWTHRQLMGHFGRSKTFIKDRLRQLGAERAQMEKKGRGVK